MKNGTIDISFVVFKNLNCSMRTLKEVLEKVAKKEISTAEA
jgi:hypothetical protein